jgi:hypothetical protein
MTQLPRSTKDLPAQLLAAFCCLLIPASASAQSADDLFLLQSAVAPNVILFMDNSDSMNQIEWHPAFDPEKVPDASYCTFSIDIPEFGGVLDPDHTYVDSQNRNNVNCDTPARGNRTVYFVQHPDDTLWSGRYLMWYLGLDETDAGDAAILDEIDNAEADVAGCTQAGASKFFAEKYRRTRFEASKQVLLDLLCVAETKNVRFGAAEFRAPADVGNVDPNGGFVSADLGRSNPNHAAELESAIKNSVTTPTDGTPLAETLFQIYTYWMPHDATTVPADMPVGLDGSPFPIYEYNKSGARVASNNWLEGSMLYECEKAFVIIVTDGLPSRDSFDSDPADTSLGFANFGTGGMAGLIGNYYADAEVEEPGTVDEATYYLDDIAKYMFDKDYRPDLGGNQTIDTYTVGFATSTATDDYLTRTAELGNGTFYKVKDGDQLTAALIAALNFPPLAPRMALISTRVSSSRAARARFGRATSARGGSMRSARFATRTAIARSTIPPRGSAIAGPSSRTPCTSGMPPRRCRCPLRAISTFRYPVLRVVQFLRTSIRRTSRTPIWGSMHLRWHPIPHPTVRSTRSTGAPQRPKKASRMRSSSTRGAAFSARASRPTSRLRWPVRSVPRASETSSIRTPSQSGTPLCGLAIRVTPRSRPSTRAGIACSTPVRMRGSWRRSIPARGPYRLLPRSPTTARGRVRNSSASCRGRRGRP